MKVNRSCGRSPSPSGRGQGEGFKIRIDFSLGFALLLRLRAIALALRAGSRFARPSARRASPLAVAPPSPRGRGTAAQFFHGPYGARVMLPQHEKKSAVTDRAYSW